MKKRSRGIPRLEYISTNGVASLASLAFHSSPLTKPLVGVAGKAS